MHRHQLLRRVGLVQAPYLLVEEGTPHRDAQHCELLKGPSSPFGVQVVPLAHRREAVRDVVQAHHQETRKALRLAEVGLAETRS